MYERYDNGEFVESLEGLFFLLKLKLFKTFCIYDR